VCSRRGWPLSLMMTQTRNGWQVQSRTEWSLCLTNKCCLHIPYICICPVKHITIRKIRIQFMLFHFMPFLGTWPELQQPGFNFRLKVALGQFISKYISWVGPRVGLDTAEKRKILHCQELNLGCPACSSSLYWLSCPDSNSLQNNVYLILDKNYVQAEPYSDLQTRLF
jgi:hypothetical protein